MAGTDNSMKAHGSSSPPVEAVNSRLLLAAGLCLLLFLALSVSIQQSLLSGIDLAAATTRYPGLAPALEALFPVAAVLWSPEVSLAYGITGALLLWRTGLGRWSLAPLAFLLVVPLEVVLKTMVHRPVMAPVLNAWPSYMLVNPNLGESFLNGSPNRTAFFCVLIGVIMWSRGGAAFRLLSVAAVALALLFGLLRVMGHYHWLSNEVASQLLGASLGLLVAAPLARRWPPASV